jgi:hypothetical protein
MQATDGSYVAISTSNTYGVGGYAMRVWHINSGGVPLCAPSFGGTGDAEGNTVTTAKNGNVTYAGASDSKGYTQGLYDVLTIRWKSDSLVNVYPFTVRNFYDTCFCTLGISLQSIFHPEVKIFPNPMSYSATLLVQGDISSHYFFNLYNGVGECILHAIPLQSTGHSQSIAHIEKNSLPSGIYICEILNQAGIKVATSKVIIE